MNRTLQTLIDDLQRFGDAPAVIAFIGAGMETRSYRGLHRDALALAGGLLGRGLGHGVLVGVIGVNSDAQVVLRLALAAIGAVAVPLDDMGSPEDFRRALADSGARALFADRQVLEQLPEAATLGLAGAWRLDGDAAGEPAHWSTLLGEPPEALPPVVPEDLAAIIYTSGTTGVAKGVPLTHANFMFNVAALAEGGFVDTSDRAALPLPLHHAYPFMAGLMVPFACGSTVILPRAPTGPDVATALRDARATVMLGVPRLYEALVEGIGGRLESGVAGTLFGALWRLSTAVSRNGGPRLGRWLMWPVRRRFAPSLRMVVSGGAKLEEGVAWRLEGLGFQVLTGYGLVETSSVTTYNRYGAGRIGTEGKPVEGSELRIAEPDEDGIGEVQIRGPHVFAGYFNDRETTASVFDEDGWFRSGDLGRIDSDGSLVVTGRSKDVIVLSGGKNVGPEEVETALAARPLIAEAAVFERGGSLAALIVPDEDGLRQARTQRLDDAIRIAVTEAGAELAPYKRVTSYRIHREPLPRTRLSKLRRFRLPELFEAAGGREADGARETDDAGLAADPRAARVLALIRARFADDSIDLATSPQLDLGVDSLAWMEIAREIEGELGVSLAPDALAEVVTLADLARAALAAPEAAPESPAETVLPSPPRGLRRCVGWAAWCLNRLVMKAAFGVGRSGPVPDAGRPVILIANHASDLDPLVLAAALPWRVFERLWWSADKARVFESPALSWLARVARLFPVDDRSPAEGLAVAGGLIDRGESVVWFPESWRSPDGRLQGFMRGIGMLLSERRVALAPAYIAGTFDVLPRHRRWPRLRRVSVHFGEPADAPREARTIDEAVAAARALVADLEIRYGAESD
ncbi:MAG: AMP-binding protein [Defluviicoccus sp.]|nr:AMP-binding protein [Defluviicoccus sp.]MDE0383029.1 AMP-binding protein [Defluviicoccus sp.]